MKTLSSSFDSDNGAYGGGGHNVEYFDSNGPLRGYKRDLYEGGIRAPLIARWPGRIQRGTVSDQISTPPGTSFPTFAEIAGAPVPADLDGISLSYRPCWESPVRSNTTTSIGSFYEQASANKPSAQGPIGKLSACNITRTTKPETFELYRPRHRSL